MRWRVAALLLIIIVVVLAAPRVRAEDTRVGREFDLEAAFLFNFAQFVDWPAAAFPDEDTPITIGVLGPDPFGPALDAVVANERVHGRAIVVKRYRRAGEIGACHILFVSSRAADPLDSILPDLARRGILTVGDSDEFARHDGMMRFVVANERLRLRINLEVARTAGLTISSMLLRQAEVFDHDRSSP